MRGLSPITTPWPNGERGLSRLDRREIQKLLSKRGYDVGDADGVLGAKSRSAIADFQEKSGQARDGRATSRVLDALRAGSSGGGSWFGGN
jgi:peptidoglycan hydrolase-like protein with peptidoglycan-binding domain